MNRDFFYGKIIHYDAIVAAGSILENETDIVYRFLLNDWLPLDPPEAGISVMFSLNGGLAVQIDKSAAFN